MRYVLLFLCLFIGYAEAKAQPPGLLEAFDSSLVRLNSIALLNEYIDSCAVVRKVPANSKEEVFLVNEIIERKFYHGYSRYSAQDNFLAYLAGKYVWDHLSAIVLPEDLVKHEMAACSQQAMVMMKLLKLRGYQVRNLGLNGHYILEVNYDNGWHVFDPNHEPIYQGIPHDSLNSFLQNGFISESYKKTLTPKMVSQVFSIMEPGGVNAVPARNARIFHYVTKFISQNIHLIIIGGCAAIFWGLRKRKKKIENLEKAKARKMEYA